MIFLAFVYCHGKKCTIKGNKNQKVFLSFISVGNLLSQCCSSVSSEILSYCLLDYFSLQLCIQLVSHWLTDRKLQRNKNQVLHWTFPTLIFTSKQAQNLYINISPAKFFKTTIYIYFHVDGNHVSFQKILCIWSMCIAISALELSQLFHYSSMNSLCRANI